VNVADSRPDADVDAEAVVVFATCLVDATCPAVGAASLRLVRSAGCAPVLARGATCCGQPALNAGFVADARRVASRTVKALARLAGPVVVPSGSCATMLARHVPEILRDTRWASQAEDVSARVVELSRFLADRQGARAAAPAASVTREAAPAASVTREAAPAASVTGEAAPAASVTGEAAPAASVTGQPCVTYHDSCHMLRELKEQDAPRELLVAAGYEIREMPGRERCCGFGGTFAVSLPAISVAMADEKLDEAMQTGAGTLVGSDVSCLMHLDGRARRRGLPLQVRHLAEVLP
jgi:L-lactate dehydrogenase complex protein LldE